MQLNELKEKDEMLRKMIKGMQENGMSLDEIAKMLNKTCLLYTSPSPRD